MTAGAEQLGGGHVLVARLDSLGDVLLSGPAVRAVAAGARRVTYLCGPRGEAAARLLPGVDDMVVHEAAWIDPEPSPLDREATLELVEDLARRGVDRALVLTSFHQSPLPLAMLLRLAGVAWVGATCSDYPGSLLDLRHLVSDDVHEVVRALSLARAAGYELPPGDAGRLSVHLPPGTAPPPGTPAGPYVVVHPGASVPARAWDPARAAELVAALGAAGHRVVVTGAPSEAALTARVSSAGAVDLGGRTTFAGLAAVLAGAEAAVVANTGPAHLAAAVGTPVVSLFAPTVPAVRWRPWGVPQVLLGDQGVACAGCRARRCPVPGHPCLDVTPPEVEEALVRLLTPGSGARSSGTKAVFPPTRADHSRTSCAVIERGGP